LAISQLIAYKIPESKGEIHYCPVTYYAFNALRREETVISPQFDVLFWNFSTGKLGLQRKNTQWDFLRFFAAHDAAENLRFYGLCGMSSLSLSLPSKYPQLPSRPHVWRTMDTGLSDNFGIQDGFEIFL